MARLWMSGGEIDAGLPGNTQNDSPDGVKTGVGTLTLDTAVFRSGLSSFKFNAGASNLSIISALGTPALWVDGRSYFLRAYVRVTAAPTTSTAFLYLDVGVSVGAQLRTDGTVELLINGVAQAGTSASITDSNWHRIEIRGVATATSTWTTVEVRVDGSSVVTWTGSQVRNGALTWGWNSGPGANKIINVDDLALNDSTGSVNNTWCGDGAVVCLVPTADSAVGTGWTNDAAGTTGLWDAENNTPPVGIADTTVGSGLHQIRNATANASVSYDATMATYTAAGVTAGSTVNAVQNWAATAAPVTTSAKQGLVGNVSNPVITTVALAAAGTSGAFWAGATAGTYGAGWKWSPGTMTEQPSVTLGTAPVMRVTQVTSSTRIAMVCGMFIYVDYTPAAAAATTSRATVTMAPYIPSRGGF